MKGKLIYLISIFLVMAILISGCNLLDNLREIVGDETKKPTPTTIVFPKETVAPTTTPISTPTVQATPTQETIWEGDSVGIWENNEFISEWAEFIITMPQNWLKLTESEIIDINQLGGDAVTDLSGETIEDLGYPNNIYPMHIMKYPLGTASSEINTNLSIFFEKTALDEDDYFEVLYEQLESLSMGYTFGSIEQLQVAGKNYQTFQIYLNEYNMQQLILCRWHEDYMVGIILTATKDDDEELNDLIGLIRKFE